MFTIPAFGISFYLSVLAYVRFGFGYVWSLGSCDKNICALRLISFAETSLKSVIRVEEPVEHTCFAISAFPSIFLCLCLFACLVQGWVSQCDQALIPVIRTSVPFV